MSSRFISLSLVAAAVVVANAVVGYQLWLKNPIKAEPTPAPSVEPTASSTPVVDETELIKQAVYEHTGLTPDQAEISVNRHIASHATGNIKEYEAVGGAYWLAAKTDSGWVGVYDGQSHPDCVAIETYAFPVDMVPECLNSSGVVVSR